MRADYGNSELNNLIEELRPKLPEFLIKHGKLPEGWTREANPRFKCINPEHDDKNPSMLFIPRTDYTVARCWGCQVKVDIFKAATWLEGLPETGKEWILETVHGLARDFEIEFKEYQPTSEELARAKIIEMLADAADCLIGLMQTSQKCDAFQHTSKRGINKDICIKMGVGTVDWDDFAQTMLKYGGWEPDFMETHGVTRWVFGQEFITITLRDHRGMCIGFDRRFALYDKEAEASLRKLGKANEYPKKWLLPRKSDVFEPSKFLYGLHIAKEKSYRQLDIVEGYFDALAGMQAGHDTIVACCGTNGISDVQMALLVDIGFEDICIVFDSDRAGQKGMERYLKEFGGNRRYRLKFKFLDFGADTTVPEKDRDPDTFFRMFCQKDMRAYDDTPIISSFRLALQIEERKGTEGDDLARAQIPHIAGEPDSLLRGKMIRELAERTKAAEVDIRASVDHILSGKAKNVARDLANELKRFEGSAIPADLSAMLKKAESRLSPLFGGSALTVTSSAAKKNFSTALDSFENDRGVIAGFRTGVPVLDEELGGIQKGMYWVVAGNPNCLAPETLILMYDGSTKRAEELIVGDLLRGDDDKPRRVLSLHSGQDQMYRVRLRNGDTYVCNSNHILVLRRAATKNNKKGKKRNGEIVELPVKSYIQKTAHFKKYYHQYKVGVEYPDVDVTLEPYFLGVWLGDGATACPKVTTADNEIRDYLEDYASRLGLCTNTYRKIGTIAVDISFSKGSRQRNYIRDELRRLGILGNKRIPNHYLINSRANRLALLAGLIDTDGYSGGESGLVFVNKNEELCDQIVVLARSLGLSARKRKFLNKRFHIYYFKVSMSGNIAEIPLLLKRKYPEKPVRKKEYSRYTCDIQSIGNGPFCGFTLDGNNRFLLADFTVSHNSGKSALIHQVISGVVQNWKENKDVCVLFFSFDDTVHWSWAKQLAIYCELPIRWVARPQTYIYKDVALTKKYRQAQSFFRDQVGETIRIFGGDIGMNIDQIKKGIRDVSELTGGKHCIVVVDSFNKMHSVDDIEGHEKYARNADDLHQLMHDGHTVIVTAETVKASQGRKPKMGDLSDTKKISFDANVCSIVYNPLHEEREKAQYFHMREDPEKGWKKSAVVQLDTVKNKITDYKDQEVFKFNDHIGSFAQIDNINAFMDDQWRLWKEHGNKNILIEPGPGGKIPIPNGPFKDEFDIDILGGMTPSND